MKKSLLLGLLCAYSMFFSQNQLVSLDPSFATQGVMITPYTSEGWAIVKIKTLLDGKILFIGDDKLTSKFTMSISRYSQSGVLDTTYGNNGYTRLTDIVDEYSCDVDDFGNVFVGMPKGLQGIKLFKVNADGQLDVAFGTNGFFYTTDFTSRSDYSQGLSVLSNGKILTTAYNGAGNQYGILRINADGTLDTSFGTNGFLSFGRDTVEIIQLTRDNNVFVQTSHYNGTGSMDLVFKKYSLDFATTYFSYTINTIDQGSVVAITDDASNNVYISSTKDDGTTECYIRKLLPSGTLDTSFGQNGIITDTGVAFADIKIDANNNILVAGIKENSTDLNPVIKRYTSQGVLDTTFNLTGIKEETYENLDFFESIELLSDGSIIGGGEANGNLFLLKYLVTDQLSTKESLKDNINIYPNPAKDILHIGVKDNVLSIEIYNTVGQLVKTTKDKSLNVSTLAKGVYFIKIKTDKNEISTKFVKG